MRFLISNDDGIDAAGLGWLHELAREHGEVSVVAPLTEQSGVGHRVSVRRPLAVEDREAGWRAVDGSPADCVRLGLCALGVEADWVLSGLNHGGNLGADVSMSGTVAAAREGALLGYQALAISHVLNSAHPLEPARAQAHVRRVLAALLLKPLPSGQYYNVNLPAAADEEEPELVFCEPDPSPHDVRYVQQQDGSWCYDGVFLKRPRLSGHDVDVAFSGKIAISVLRVV